MSDFLEAIDQLLARLTPREQAVDHLVEGGTMEGAAFSCSVEHRNEWARGSAPSRPHGEFRRGRRCRTTSPGRHAVNVSREERS